MSGAFPLVSSGGANPSLSISQANSTNSGYLASSDWVIFNNKLGTTSVFAGDVSGAYNSMVIAPNAVSSAKMTATGVSAGVYGSAISVPVFTIDAAGRVTAASVASISGGGGMASLPNGQIWVGNRSNVATGVFVSWSTNEPAGTSSL